MVVHIQGMGRKHEGCSGLAAPRMWQRSESLASIRTKRIISITLPQGCAKITWFERSSVCLVWDDAETC